MDLEDAAWLLAAIVVGILANSMLFAPLATFIGGFVALTALTKMFVVLVLAAAVFGIVGKAMKLPMTVVGAAVGVVVLSELWTFLGGVPYGQLVFGAILALALVGAAFNPIREALNL